jgi:hypothetical protein
VYKFGYSKDIQKRTKQHIKTFIKKGCKIVKLKIFNFIDPINLSKAEKDIKDYMNDHDYKLIHGIYKELVVFSDNHYKSVYDQYNLLTNKYMGHIKELINKIEKLENEKIIQKREYNHIISINKLEYENNIKRRSYTYKKIKGSKQNQ